jgi:hypothetical protein
MTIMCTLNDLTRQKAFSFVENLPTVVFLRFALEAENNGLLTSAEQKMSYMIANPVRAGLVTDPAHWPHQGEVFASFVSW